MDPVLQQELVGRKNVTVSLGGQEYPLEFSLYAVILYKQHTGDNLFDGACWEKIAPLEDPERFLTCLWAGLHAFDPVAEWKSPFTRNQLARIVDFTNVTPVCTAIALALASYFPKPKPKEDPPAGADSSGKAPLPAPAEASSESSSSSPSVSPSGSSGPLPATISG